MKKWGYIGVALLLLLGVYQAFGHPDYYQHGSFPAPGSPATSAGMRAELDLISAGFDKLPTLTGNANKAVIVNGSATALGVTTGTLTLPGNFALSGTNAVTLTTTGTTNVTLPTTGTLSTLAGSETLTTKTFNLGSNTLTGTLAQFNTALSDADFATLAGLESLSNKNLPSPVLSGTVTGTYTLGGTPTITSPAISGPTLSGTATGTYTLGGTPTITAPAISAPVFSGTASGSLTNLALTTPALTSATLTTSTVAADPTTALGVASKQYVERLGFTTGDVKLTLKTVADTSWILMDDGTIGSASSGATTRANADTEPLYTLIWTNITDQWAPVIGGRGASAAADFAANKPLRLPRTLGRALAGYGTGITTTSGGDGDVDLTANTLTVPSNDATWITGMSVVFTLTSGTITGLTSGNTYYTIRNNPTTVKLASSLANAQNGTAIDFTAKSSPSWTITHTYTTGALGEHVGERAHAMSITELLSHQHTTAIASGGGGVLGEIWDANTNAGILTGATGGNSAMNIMQPTVFLNVMVKL